jgi:hypothetical protein
MTDESPFETKNLAFYGTFFTEGSGKVVVYATGDRTFLGNIASSTLNTVKNQSTLNIEIHYFIKIMASIAISLGVVFFIIAITAVQYPILEVPAPSCLALIHTALQHFTGSLTSLRCRLSFSPSASSSPTCPRGCCLRCIQANLCFLLAPLTACRSSPLP